MTKREQLQAEIIEKQKEIDKAKDVVIEHYRNCMRKLTLYSPETIGYQEGVIKNIESELSALTAELEKENAPKVFIDVSPNKGEKVCRNCQYFTQWGVASGICLRKDLRGNNNRTERDTCYKFFPAKGTDK